MKKEIKMLQMVMKQHDLAMYLVPTSDVHQSEYIAEYYEFRAYLSGFTGSAGTLLVTQQECLLWTDGRYFIQAEKQLKNSGICLMRSGEKGVPNIVEYIETHIQKDQKLGFYGEVFSYKQVNDMIVSLKMVGAEFVDVDLTDEVWKNRPAIAINQIRDLDVYYTGATRKEKLSKVRLEMKKAGANIHVISSLDDIAWIFNLRGKDILYNPVFYSYAVITQEKAALFIRDVFFQKEIVQKLKEEDIEVYEYDDLKTYMEQQCYGKQILIDTTRTSYRIICELSRNNQLIEKENPSIFLKAIKNEVECEHMKESHKIDGLVMIRFLYWLKKQMSENIRITECDAADYLDHLRLNQENCMGLSFGTIAAYGKNAAMCHYSPNRENPVMIEKCGFLLVDSGGQYLTGTTDVTRTIAVGPLSQKEKEHYTRVLQGHIRLSMARFPYGVCGANLDVLARGPLWDAGLDFNHGTGHGVGYYLNVHEDPNHIHWNLRHRNRTIPLQPGMLTSNEPGLYIEGKYGIRIENLILTKNTPREINGDFLEFETVTMVPYERDAILTDMLSDDERRWLNAYHDRIYQLYERYLSVDECRWLKSVTDPLS